MSDSFVVSTGGSITGGGRLMDSSKAWLMKPVSVPRAVIIAVIMVVVIIIIVLSIKSSSSFQGIGAAGTGSVRFTDSYGLGSNKSSDKLDTFLNMNEPPIFNDVPNFILTKEDRMQAALHAYAKLRKEAMSRDNLKSIPTWNEYWSDWQKSQDYDYSGRTLYDIEGGGVHVGENEKAYVHSNPKTYMTWKKGSHEPFGDGATLRKTVY